MSELDDAENYAAAALFTLALYSSQVEVGVDRFQETAGGEYRASAWGCPPDLDLDEVLFGENLRAEDLTHFWGWDCCGDNGLCQSIYQNLQIPKKRWTGLLKVPETVGDVSTDSGIDELIQIVERYSRMLDPELCYTKGKAVEIFSVQRQRSISLGELDVVAAGSVPEEDEELTRTSSMRHDKRSDSIGRKLPGITEDSDVDPSLDQKPLLEEPPAETPSEEEALQRAASLAAEEDGEKLMEQRRVSVFAEAEEIPFDEDPSTKEISDADAAAVYEEYVESLKPPEELGLDDETEDVVIPKAGFAPRSDYNHPASAKSCLALRAMIKAALLENALVVLVEREETEEDPLPVCLQWYDARCRIALMRMAHWLRIPWLTMTAFEAEAAFDHLKLKDDEAVTKKSNTISRWLKISAMALGGGAAVAFTGGLAAPAVAAGLGAAVTMAGGTAATASAVTGFAASTAGTATITTAFGAFGAHSTGSTMYKRTTDVKEFAFWDLSMDWDKEIEKKKQRSEKTTSRFWPWNKTKKTSKAAKSQSASQPLTDREQSSSNLDAASNEPPVDTGAAKSGSLGAASEKRVTVVPGVEVALDEMEPTQSTSNYTEWWEGLVRAKERPDLLALPVNTRGDNCNLALTIAISGVINDDKHFIEPWKKLPSVSCDRFAVIWESKLLKKVNDALFGLITSQVANEAAKWFIQKYLYTGLLAAVAVPVLITTLVDVTVGNNWATAMDRSLKAGELLAQYFIQGLHGHRPVTLIGYSLGARCIFRCLLTLYNAGKRGVIENVVLLGAPVSLTDYKWARARSVVAGRFVNGYTTRDWVLGIVFRIGRGVLQNVAGISPVGVPGIENLDLSTIVGGQTEYSVCMKDILAALHL